MCSCRRILDTLCIPRATGVDRAISSCFRPPSFVRSVGPTLPDTDPTHGSSVIAGIVDVTPQFGRVCEKSTVRLEGRYIRGVCPTRAW